MAGNPDENNVSPLLSFLYIILKSELRLDDHILGLKSTVMMKRNQIISRMIFFGIMNMFEG